MSPPKTPAAQRIQQNSVEDAEGCWIWMLATLKIGYGRIKIDRKTKLAHRVAYEAFIGPIPEGMTVDHVCHDPLTCQGGVLCKHRRCVNPKHLRVATMRENALRGNSLAAHNLAKTHCPRGHPYSEGNTRYGAQGRRFCIICTRENDRIAHAARRARLRDRIERYAVG